MGVNKMNNYENGVEVRDVQDFPEENIRCFLISTKEKLKKGSMFKVDKRAHIAQKVTLQQGNQGLGIRRLWIEVKLPQS
jgi:hypothetical protein